MARTSSRPRPIAVGPLRVEVVRGPKEGQWYWRVVRYQDGQATTRALGWMTQAEAVKAAAAMVAEGEAPEPKRREEAPLAETVTDLVELYVGSRAKRTDITRRTIGIDRSCGRALKRLAGDVRLDRLDARALEEYRDRRLRETRRSSKGEPIPGKFGIGPRTVALELTILRRAWQWGRSLGLTPDRDLPEVQICLRDTRDRYTPTREELARVLARLEEKAPPWAGVVMRLLMARGPRMGEVARLRWGQILWDRKVLVFDGKTGRREVPVSAELLLVLRSMGPAHPDTGVWPVTPKSCQHLFVSEYLREACLAAKVPPFTPHGIRRHIIDRLLGSGVDVAASAKMLGNSPITQYKYYRKATQEDIARAVEKARLDEAEEG